METITIRMEEYTSTIEFSSYTDVFADNGKKKIFICDRNTAFLIPEPLYDETVIIKSGEKYKTWKSIDSILRKALLMDMGRDDFFIGIGGGVITDMTAFASSLYMRGCGLLLAPTTVLSMVDAAIGGKTGVDYHSYKNMIGSFYPAQKIIIDTRTLESLKEREYKSGLAEILKAAFLAGGNFLEYVTVNREKILERNEEVLRKAIYMSIQVKATTVEKDLREQNIRGYLNLGHTFGHALESASDFRGCLHGEAVAWGIARAMDAGIMLKKTNSEYAEKVRNLLTDYGFEIKNKNIKIDKVMKAMVKDKKKRNGNIRFVLQKDAGITFFEILDYETIKKVME